LSPKYKDKNTGRIFGSLLTSSRHDELSYAESQQVITSGNLVKLSVFDTVGYFNEALFIDYVDYEYCLRCITQEYKIIEVKSAVLIHSLGSSTQHKLLWKRPLAFHHSPLRRYYIARNAIYTYKRFFFKHPVWIIKNAYGLAKNVILIMLFENDRKKKLNATFKGVIDGVLGQMGKCRSPI